MGSIRHTFCSLERFELVLGVLVLGGSAGDGFTTNRITAGPTLWLSHSVVVLACGALHCCAIQSGVGLFVWGANTNGQVCCVPFSLAFVAYSIVSLCVSHTLVPSLSQLGDGTILDRTSPFQLTGMSSMVFASAGMMHTCAGNATTVVCFGYGGDGQLGYGGVADTSIPVVVPMQGSVGVAGVVAGSDHTCVLLGDGNVTCFGSGGQGQCGDGAAVRRLSPQSLVVFPWLGPSPSPSASISASTSLPASVSPTHSPASPSPSRTPAVALLASTSRMMSVSSGGYHSCSALFSGDIACWGQNTYGQLGESHACSLSDGILRPVPVGQD